MTASYTTPAPAATTSALSIPGVRHTRVNELHAQAIADRIRGLAEDVLTATKGRKTYEYTASKGRTAGLGGADSGRHGTGTGAGRILLSLDILRDQGADTDPVFQAKRDILWLLLDPTLDIAGEASQRNQQVPSAHRETIRVRLLEILEQKVLLNPLDRLGLDSDVRGGGLDLEMLVRSTPLVDADGAPVLDEDGQPTLRQRANAVGWARQLLISSAGIITNRIVVADPSDLQDFYSGYTDSGFGTINSDIYLPSVEDTYFDESDPTDSEILVRWQERSHFKRGRELAQLGAEAILEQYRLPTLIAPEVSMEKLSLGFAVKKNPALALISLRVCEGLADISDMTGDIEVDDALLSLWDDYSADDRDRLLEAGSKAVLLLVEAALALPNAPRRDIIGAARTALRAATPARGWTGLSNRAMTSYIAQSHLPNDHNAFARVDADEQLALAAQWPALAQEIIDHPGNPAGAAETVAAVAELFARSLVAARESFVAKTSTAAPASADLATAEVEAEAAFEQDASTPADPDLIRSSVIAAPTPDFEVSGP